MRYPTFGLARTSSVKRCTPDGPALSDDTTRFEPIPILITANGAPDGKVVIRLESTSGQLPFALLVAAAPSVIELPKAMATLLVTGAQTCKPDAISTSVVELENVVKGSVVDAV